MASYKRPMLQHADMIQKAKRPELRLVKTPTYVGVERATILGPDPLRPVEGQVYVVQSDGSLRLPLAVKALLEYSPVRAKDPCRCRPCVGRAQGPIPGKVLHSETRQRPPLTRAAHAL